jgi:hypothetical protein
MWDIDEITDEATLDELDYDALLTEGMVVLVDQRDAVRALFDKGTELLEVLTTPPPVPTLADLLASFDLEAAYANKQAVIHWDASEARQAVHDAAADAQASVDAARTAATADPPDPNTPLATTAASTVDAARAAASSALAATASITDKLDVPKDAVHVSDSALVFKDWHIKSFPAEPWQAPYSMPLEDDTIVAAIKKARQMVPVIPHGAKGTAKPQYAGTMAWTPFVMGSKKLEGWMYVEPRGEYQDYFWGRVHSFYSDAAAEADKVAADPVASASLKTVMAARAKQRNIAAAAATFRQEGLPPAINTYDGTVLTWCSGLAAPGMLPRIFNALMRDENCAKVMYLCGFLYTGNDLDAEYQIADVESDVPRVYHRNNFMTQDQIDPDTGKKKYPKGTRDCSAFKVLEHFTDQLPLIYMLIALSRDELTRDRVFDPNFAAMAAMVDIAGAENIFTESLYIFIGEVQHNWALNGRKIFTAATRDKTHRPSSLVAWAIAHFSADEKALTLPSEEGDRAIAKGVFRFVLRSIQEDAFGTAVVLLKVKCRRMKTSMLTGDDPIQLSSVTTLYGFTRLVENYWTPMQTGLGPAKFKPHQIDESTLTVAGFPVRLASAEDAPPDEQVVRDSPVAGTFWSVGKQAQCEFLFPNDVSLMGFDAAGNVLVQDAKTKAQWGMKKDSTTQEWQRVQ